MGNLYIGTQKPKGIYLGSQKVKAMYLGMQKVWESNTSRLPAEYQEVEWIGKASGSGAFISLGVRPIEYGKVLFKYQGGTTATRQYIFGTSLNDTAQRFFGMYENALTQLDFYFRNSTGYSAIISTLSRDEVNKVEFDYFSDYVDIISFNKCISSYSSSQAASTFTATKEFGVFSRWYGTEFNVDTQPAKLWYLKYEDANGDLLIDLVPCYRTSDNTIGMYDLATKNFYSNVGSGSFIKGNDVTGEIIDNLYVQTSVKVAPTVGENPENNVYLGARINSSKKVVYYSAGRLLTRLIPASVGDTFVIKTDSDNKVDAYSGAVAFCDSNGDIIYHATSNYDWDWQTWNSDNTECTLTIPNSVGGVDITNTAYVRFTPAFVDSDNIVITKKYH